MRRTAAILAAFLFAVPALGQTGRATMDVTRETVNVDGSSSGYSGMVAPSGCAAGYVPYFNADLKLVCSPTVYAPATDTTTATGTIAARNLTATALATPVITPPIANVLSLFTTVTVVAGASLVDGDYFTLSDGSAVVYEFDNDANVTVGRVGITFTGAESAQAIRDLVVVAINGSTLEATAIAAAADTLTVTSDTAGDSMGVNSENVANAGFLVPVWGEPTHATTYGDKVEACLADGSCAPSAEVQTAAGHATLSNANYNSVTWGAVTGASYYKLTRVTGTPAGGDAPPRLLYTGPLLNFSDTNAASTSEAVATANETGVLRGAGIDVSGHVYARERMHIGPPITLFGGDGGASYPLQIKGEAGAGASILYIEAPNDGDHIFLQHDGTNGWLASDGEQIISGVTYVTLKSYNGATYATTAYLAYNGSLFLSPLATSDVFRAYRVNPYDGDDADDIGTSALRWRNLYLSRATLGSKSKSLTDATPTAFATFTIADAATYGGKVVYSVVATQGTALQRLDGEVRFNATREGSTYTATVGTTHEALGQVLSAAVGTLAGGVTIACTAGVCTLSANFDTSQASPDSLTFSGRFDSPDAGLTVTWIP